MGFSFFAGGKHPTPSEGGFLGVGFDGTGGVKIGTVFLKRLGSDLVVQSSCSGYPEQNFALYHLGMVPGGKVLKGVRQGWIFMFFGGRY